MKMIAQKAFAYPLVTGRKLKAGDTFEAPDQLARVLLVTRLATEASTEPQPREKRKYRRRDMTAEGTQTMTVEDD